MTKLAWNPFSDHNILAVGCFDGTVAVYFPYDQARKPVIYSRDHFKGIINELEWISESVIVASSNYLTKVYKFDVVDA